MSKNCHDNVEKLFEKCSDILWTLTVRSRGVFITLTFYVLLEWDPVVCILLWHSRAVWFHLQVLSCTQATQLWLRLQALLCCGGQRWVWCEVLYKQVLYVQRDPRRVCLETMDFRRVTNLEQQNCSALEKGLICLHLNGLISVSFLSSKAIH